MLVLARKEGESVICPDQRIVVTVLSIDGKRVRLGFTAPADVAIHREEVWDRETDREYLRESVSRSVELMA